MSQAVLSQSTLATHARFAADTLSKSIVLIGCLMVLQRGIGFLRSFYVCGMLSPAEVGRWDLAFSFLALAGPLAVLGIPGSFGRYVAHYRMRDEQGRFFKQTFIACFALVLVASGMIYSLRTDIAIVLLGSETHGEIVALMAAGLPIVVFFNFATC
jgi:O-antigen/teichoic acid export membrane protein